jgi:hypothetical protein
VTSDAGRTLPRVKVHDHFEIVELGDKFTVVDRSVTPGRTIGVHDTWEEASKGREFLAVEPDEWLRDPLLTAIARHIAQSQDMPYGSVVRRLEELGVDEMWLVVGDGIDLIERAAGLKGE